jgi:hypothetical protein
MTSPFFGAFGRRRPRKEVQDLSRAIVGTARRTTRLVGTLKESAGKALSDEQQAHQACTLDERQRILLKSETDPESMDV